MHRNDEIGSRARGWLPRSALPCVWMEAGLLAYKLCERERDCEHCPLDAALTGDVPLTRTGDAAPGPSIVAEPGRRLQFRPDRRYHASHGWVLSRSPARVRYGLDMLAGNLLGHVSAVILPSAGSQLRRERPACWLEYEGELLPFRSPVSGTVLASNPRLRQDPDLFASSPYDEGWLLDVRPDAADPPDRTLMSAAQMRAHTAGQLLKLRAARRHATEQDARVGATLADGGQRLTGSKRVLGAARYRRLIASLLG